MAPEFSRDLDHWSWMALGPTRSNSMDLDLGRLSRRDRGDSVVEATQLDDQLCSFSEILAICS